MKEIKITEIKGIKVGNAQNTEGATGCTAVICEAGGIAGVDVRGGSPATRETDLLNPVHTNAGVHCIMLSGGSAYGLDAASGAMQYLEEQNIGFDVQVGVVPIVCGASLFDLVVGNSKCRPDKQMGYAACENAQANKLEEGNVGAGTGACIGKLFGKERAMKGGLGSFGLQVGELQVASIVAVNCLGNIIDPETGGFIAGLLDETNEKVIDMEALICSEYADKTNLFSGNTTIGVVVTNGKVTKSQACKIASIAHNGYDRAIRPAHTSFDGDTIFVLATGEVACRQDAVALLAAKTMSEAVVHAVKKAEPAYGLKAACELR